MIRVWIGMGSNQHHPGRQLDRALQQLETMPRSHLIACSPRYWTSPWGDTDQPDFLNAVVEVGTELQADNLLQALHRIEDRQGRQREASRPWGPRPLDLDLLLFGEQTIDTGKLQVPHPRMTERAFVLVPLLDLSPEIVIPGKGRAADCLTKLNVRDLRRADQVTIAPEVTGT